ncbi:MAG: DUF1924 domain-containing protein [Hyphomicrobiales bacterium]|nr:DUF1924 domain-containing protein [Hyphomicrobiales bacterium]
MKKFPVILTALLGLTAIPVAVAVAGPAQDAVIRHYAGKAKTGGFSAARGKKLFLASPGAGKPETPSCTSCHTTSPANAGRTRAGKPIEPLALSRTPGRYSDLSKVEKWFGRNCRSVLGRECTSQEKGDFLTFMTGQ